jgi:hypothetical protein
MGLLDRIFGRTSSHASSDRSGTPTDWPAGQQTSAAAQDPDEVAVQRYRYMLRTAPPETVEQAHTEAFEKLTPEQRRRVLDEVGNTVPESERATSDDPRSLARMATRAEMRQPGTMERVLGGGGRGGGMGMGGMIAGSLLASVAGAFIGTSIASAFMDDGMGGQDMAGGEDTAGAEPGAQDMGDPGFSDPGMNDFGGDFGV